ncbi:CBS domain-containing protein, partial [Candidatus Dependentiae bacterium]|nr:CBS domain-containing protein [Candidatus Dependentiae bacterium]
RNIKTLKKENMVFEVSDLIVNSTQEYYPIIEDEIVIGVIPKEEIFKRYYEGDLRVKLEVMISDKFLTIKETDDLFKAFMAIVEKRAKLGVIYRNGVFAGILTLHEINNIYQLMKK